MNKYASIAGKTLVAVGIPALFVYSVFSPREIPVQQVRLQDVKKFGPEDLNNDGTPEYVFEVRNPRTGSLEKRVASVGNRGTLILRSYRMQDGKLVYGDGLVLGGN